MTQLHLLCRFTKHDTIAVCLAIFLPLTAIVLTMVSILPALGAPPLPDFSNPVKVWYIIDSWPHACAVYLAAIQAGRDRTLMHRLKMEPQTILLIPRHMSR